MRPLGVHCLCGREECDTPGASRQGASTGDAMSLIQQLEEEQYSASARFDRFDGFDRGDLDYDYEEEQRARNEEDEREFQAAQR